MHNKLLLAALGIAVAVPMISLAQTAVVSSGAAAMGAASAGPAVMVNTICPQVSRTLARGSRGGDVTNLQNYLIAQGYLNTAATGYFGALTEAAVKQWQSDNSVASASNAYIGWGIFGVRSRGVLRNRCGHTAYTQALNADPSSGAAPLSVYFSYKSDSGKIMAIDFGDGSTGQMQYIIPPCMPGAESCTGSYAATHSYASAGTYAARVSPVVECFKAPCPTFPAVASAVVTVTDNSTPATIQKINAPANVTLPLNGVVEVRNENMYFALQSVANTVATIMITPVGCWNSFPSDPPSQMRCMIAIQPTPPVTLALGQVYATQNYAITLTSISGSSATFSVVDTSAANKPSITGLDAPTSLAVGQSGTWSVHATALGDSQLNYSVVWGDEQNADMSVSATLSSSVWANSTFTHVYSRAGTYRPVFTVSNGAGTVQTSSTVIVR